MKHIVARVNCHGCKWLDRYKEDGNGYCCMVERSKGYRGQYIEDGRLMPGSKVRTPNMEPCELYESGSWEFRYRAETP